MFWERFYNQCIKCGTKPNPLGQQIGISSGIISKWKTGAIPNGENLAKIADALNCSIDYLLGRTDDEHGSAPALTAKDEKDIEKILQHTKEQLKDPDRLTLDGVPVTKDAVDSILAAIELGLQAAKMRNQSPRN